MTEDQASPLDVERRRRRISRSTYREPCDRCGGPMVLKVRGRDRRALCKSCQHPPSTCGCRPVDPARIPIQRDAV